MVESLIIADNTVISNFAMVSREDILQRIFDQFVKSQNSPPLAGGDEGEGEPK